MTTAVDTHTIEALLQKSFAPTELSVIDEGSLHAGHAHSGHFRVVIQSASFNEKTPVEIHRMIYNVLQIYLDNGIHALAIDAKAVKI